MKYPTAAEFDVYPAWGGRTPRERLMASYVVEPNGCWTWTRSRTGGGYGHFHFAGAYYQAHRLMYVLYRGPITAETIDHLCRNRACVNPRHMEPVSHRENSRRGQQTRLNRKKVALIHAMSARGLSTRAIGARMKVDHSTVSRVLTGRLWAEFAPKKERVAA